MKYRPIKFSLILSAAGLLIISGVSWLLISKSNQDVAVPPDFRVERQVTAEGSGEIMPYLDIYIENGTLWYENREQSRKLTDSELKTLISKKPWPVNDSYTSDGGGDTALTTLVIVSNGEETRIEFDDAWGTKVSEQVLEFDAYLNRLAGYPSYRFSPSR